MGRPLKGAKMHSSNHLIYFAKNYLRSLLLFLIGVILAVVICLYQFNPTVHSKSRYAILDINNQPSEVMITDDVPQQTSRVYLDFNQPGLKASDVTISDASTGKVYQTDTTPYGSTLILRDSQFSSALDLKLSTLQEGNLGVLITYVNANFEPISEQTHSLHFERSNWLLNTVFYVLIGIMILCFLISIKFERIWKLLKVAHSHINDQY
jgi:uncharacterized membrane protein